MARRANTALDSKTARLKLKPRKQSYFTQVAPHVTLGYVRRDPPPGTWTRRECIEGRYTEEQFATADDVGVADGRTVMTYLQARAYAADEGAPSPSKDPLTVKRALDAYLQELATHSKHAKEARQRADKHIVPILGKHRLTRLTKRDVEQWRATLVKPDSKDDPDAKRRSQDNANRVLSILKAALNHAFSDDSNAITTDNAWRKVKAFRSVGAAREDHFDGGQIKLLIAKATTFDRAFANLCEAAYLTGARLGELTALHVKDFDPKGGALRIRLGKTGARNVTLTSEAVAFFRRLSKDRLPKAVLLPRADGEPWGKSEQHRPFKRAAKLAELPKSASFYSLRHSYISRAIENGMPLSLIAENCGTSLLMIQRNYSHVLAHTRRDTIEATAPKLRRVK